MSEQSRIEAALEIEKLLLEAEAAIDNAVAAAAELAGRMPAARMRLRLSVNVSQSAMAHTTEVLGMLIQARNAIGAAHDDLGDISEGIGIKEKLTGGGVYKGSLRRNLTLVASRGERLPGRA